MGSSPPLVSLFAYGTLVFPEIWSHVTGDTEARRSEPATLGDFALRRVRDAEFPGIVAEPGAPPVPGVVYFDLDAKVLARLDAYEDGFYERIGVRVALGNPERILDCQTYAVPPPLREQVLTDERWTAEDFAARHLRAFARRLRDAGQDGD